MNLNHVPLLLCVVGFLSACEFVAVQMAPARTAAPNAAAEETSRRMLMDALANGSYNTLPALLDTLTRLALDNPRNPGVHLMLGMTHLWAVAEGDRVPNAGPTLTNHIILSRHYLESAGALDPTEARVQGWSASMGLASASLVKDEAATRRAHFQLMRGVKAWPEFNQFTRSYTSSRLPWDHPRFQEDVVMPMFESMELCFGVRMDAAAPDWEAARKGMAAFVADPHAGDGARSVCVSSDKVPGNLEGFFTHFGDVLTKAGRPTDALAAYGLARLSPHHGSWAFRDALQDRVDHVQERVALLQAAQRAEGMLVTSRMACVVCHQR